jgi:hypothetical protein
MAVFIDINETNIQGGEEETRSRRGVNEKSEPARSIFEDTDISPSSEWVIRVKVLFLKTLLLRLRLVHKKG